MEETSILAGLLAGLQLVEHELLLFAAFWFVVGAADEMAVDLAYLSLRWTGAIRKPPVSAYEEHAPLQGRIAVFVPAWHESDVLGLMIRHMLLVWPQADLTLYVGCYRNDAATIAAAMKGAEGDPRLRIVINDRDGPTTKADCLNRLYRAMSDDERRSGKGVSGVILHDAEDMVHPAGLVAIDRGLSRADFVQLPVRPEPQAASRWIAGHYADEFAEAHGKTLVVRDALGAAIPAAGVGCGFSREALGELASAREATGGPFAEECLTEDYELGLLVSRGGARGTFLRLRDRYGDLVATRSYFPATLDEAVRQKTRWIHGIAFQGWDRLGWGDGLIDRWMTIRDRRGPFMAIVLAAAYLLLAIEGVLALARLSGWSSPFATPELLKTILVICFAAVVWRALWRFVFTATEYGLREGLFAVLRIPLANIIMIMAGRRALMAYVRTLLGHAPSWDKTHHGFHPTMPPPSGQAALR